MRRRDFFSVLGGAAAVWPNMAIGQQLKRAQSVRRIAVLTGAAGSVSDARVRVLVQALGELGWLEARNVRFEIRHGGGDAGMLRQHAEELVALAPDVIAANGGTATEHLLRATRTIPIVFSFVPDPVGSGFVDSLSRPGGNATGFTQFEYGISAKWLELLKEISPKITRVAVLRDSTGAAGVGQFAVIQAAAPLQGVEVRPINVRDRTEIERDVADFAASALGVSGMIVVSSTNALVHRKLIVELAARRRSSATGHCFQALPRLGQGGRFYKAFRGLLRHAGHGIRHGRRHHRQGPSPWTRRKRGLGARLSAGPKAA